MGWYLKRLYGCKFLSWTRCVGAMSCGREQGTPVCVLTDSNADVFIISVGGLFKSFSCESSWICQHPGSIHQTADSGARSWWWSVLADYWIFEYYWILSIIIDYWIFESAERVSVVLCVEFLGGWGRDIASLPEPAASIIAPRYSSAENRLH